MPMPWCPAKTSQWPQEGSSPWEEGCRENGGSNFEVDHDRMLELHPIPIMNVTAHQNMLLTSSHEMFHQICVLALAHERNGFGLRLADQLVCIFQMVSFLSSYVYNPNAS